MKLSPFVYPNIGHGNARTARCTRLVMIGACERASHRLRALTAARLNSCAVWSSALRGSRFTVAAAAVSECNGIRQNIFQRPTTEAIFSKLSGLPYIIIVSPDDQKCPEHQENGST